MNEKCFGRRRDRECAVLADKICYGNYNVCPFYKPKWKADHDRAKALHFIARLPLDEQEKISLKYYQGQMPWKKEEL